MSIRIPLAVLFSALLAATAAHAGPRCTKAPQSQWLDQKEFQTKLREQGYQIDRFLISGPCYEIYGKDKDGHKVEIYFDPTDGRIVKQERR